MSGLQLVSLGFVLVGAMFVVAGTVGLLRFPDALTRLHALTKVDNLGLGLLIIGLALQADSWAVVGKLLLIWLLVLVSSATVACLIAGVAARSTDGPMRRDEDA